MSKLKEIECSYCHKMFIPSKFSPRQKYCSRRNCQKASHRASQARQRKKACNQTLEKRIQNSEAVRDWQRRNPGYWKKRKKKSKKNKAKSLKSDIAYAQKNEIRQAVLSDLALEKFLDKVIFQLSQLSDKVDVGNCIQTGIISQLSDSVLSDFIVSTKNVFYDKGKNILGLS